MEKGGERSLNRWRTFPKSLVPLFSLFVFLFFCFPVSAEEGKEDPGGQGGLKEALLSRLRWGGYLKNESAYRIIEPRTFTKILNIAQLETHYDLLSNVQLTVIGRAYYDLVYDLVDIDTIAPRKFPRTILIENPTPDQIPKITIDNVRNVDIDKWGVKIREAYLDVSLPAVDLRAGKQIVRWGVVEGARVTDEINPLDFSEFILRDVSDRYVPLWMVKADFYPPGDFTLETIWIPQVQSHIPARAGSEWEQFVILPGLEKPEHAWKDFPNHLDNSEAAVKVSKLVLGWDLSASYFYAWDPFPTNFRTTTILEGGQFSIDPNAIVLVANPRYTRVSIFGTTFSKSVSGFVWSGEWAYVAGKHFGAGFTPNPDFVPGPGAVLGTLGEEKRDYMKYAIQADFRLFGVEVSAQALQHYIINWDPAIIQARFDTVFGVFARKELSHGSVIPSVLILYFVNNIEVLTRPRVDFQMTDRLKVSFGGDFMYGTIGGTLPGDFHFVGFFKNSSRIYVEFKYSF